MDKLKNKTTIITTSILVIGLFVIFCFLGNVSISSYSLYNAQIEDAYYDASNYDFLNEIPLNLDGYWLEYEGVYFDEQTVDYDVLEDGNYQQLPITSLDNAKGTTSYLVNICLSQEQMEEGDLLLSIPYIDEDVNVYINGIQIDYFDIKEGESVFHEEYSMFDILSEVDYELEYQEIIISINDDLNDTDLFKRDISLSTESNLLYYQTTVFLMEIFLVCTMIATIIVACVYILFYSQSKALVYTNLFSCALLIHIVFGMTTIPMVLFSGLIESGFGDILFARIAKASLILALFIGNILSIEIFDSKRRVSPKVDKAVNVLLLLLTIASYIYPQLMNNTGVIAVSVFLSISMFSLLNKIYVKIKNNSFTSYYQFHFIKSILIGTVIFIDLITINEAMRLREVLVVSYGIFYIVILATHGYEYQFPLIHLSKKNELLEELVEKRTQELKKLNNELRLTNERDALTGASNRLFFEQKLDEYLNKVTGSIYMCIFDIDDFKKINDVYGHSVGDDQLIEIVETCKAILPKDTSLSRIGGEEFAILFVDKPEITILPIIERIRWQLENNAKKEGRTTGSFGVYKSNSNDKRKEIFIKADECLYYAKSHGKNTIAYNFDGEIKENKKWANKVC
ncbi:GGDEF domain-containing protein [Tannockella kyphosi]|uniref:GGDEF domain-containing protein n=1 Tax=Tannockella kyphosi TaxID=2899121 RepID=UPI002012650C|nr:GGDEF domain-containing protein [Tannockella kyphosi]